MLALSNFAAQAALPVEPAAADNPAPVRVTAGTGDLPPIPRGKSTVMGGEIRSVDPVRDQFTLKVFGGHPVKILFDERTQVYENGKRVDLLDLHPAAHASIETTLDGTKIFALRIHTLTELPEGETRGRVQSYNAHTGELTIDAAQSKQGITLKVPADVSVKNVSQMAGTSRPGSLSDITRGSLIDVTFRSSSSGHGEASHIDVLATPGASFVFSGSLTSVNSHAGRMVLVDSDDGQTYQIAYDPSHFHISHDLHQGSHVKISTTFDGSKYVASEITME
jgi:YD repeat-containing protein